MYQKMTRCLFTISFSNIKSLAIKISASVLQLTDF